jgi:PAS domain S-box-containing protein
VAYLDGQGNVSLCNRKMEEVTGMSRQDIIGKPFFPALFRHGQARAKEQMFKAVMDDSVSYKRPNTFEGVAVDANNAERLISWNISPIAGESGAPEGIFLIGNDITHLKDRESDLKSIDETLKSIFSSIKDYALYVINLDGNITYYGMGSEALFGWKKDEIIFKHVRMLHANDDIVYRLSFVLEQAKRCGQYEMETFLVKRDGSTFPVILTVSQFLDASGKLAGYIFMAKDVTERKRLEYQIFQAEKLAAIGQLAAGMAHDINNPLFVISGRLEMLMQEKRLSAKTKSDIRTMLSQTERIRSLSERLLKFSRKSAPVMEELNMNEVIEGVLPLLACNKLPGAQIEIEKRLENNLPSVNGNLNQLQEVLVNLLMNAHQAMPAGGTVTVSTANFQNLFAEIRVSDTGCGIPEENLKNIFMPFFTTKREGTGLGLSICYNIIKNHNGSIDIETQANKGTTFIIKLPFA